MNELRRFILKDESKEDKLLKLIKKKSLSHKDLVLILQAIKLNPDIFQQVD